MDVIGSGNKFCGKRVDGWRKRQEKRNERDESDSAFRTG
jgi:hypothetical protein